MYLIYKITNTVNEKLYIGLTGRNLKVRFREHRCLTSYKSAISNAVRKYGRDAFTIQTIDTADYLNDALMKETNYIKTLNTNVLNGCGYNIIGDTFGCEYTFSMKLANIESKRRRKLNSTTSNTPYIGVFFSEECQKWTWAFSINGEKVSMKRFQTDKDAAISRDMKLLEIFDTTSALRMMNFPENIDLYLNNEIKHPIRNLKKNLKKSKFKHVSFEKQCNQWRFSMIQNHKHIRVGNFHLESDAAEYSDFYRLKILDLLNIELNFPSKDYHSDEYYPPKTVSASTKKCPYQNISCEIKNGSIYYRAAVQHNGTRQRYSSTSLEKTISKRNTILSELCLPIPNDFIDLTIK